MRPHRLRFAGIGPYPQLVEVDFDDLGELGLYLIVGPTGAGKTTIFDAITFALYGRVAGDRDEKGIISDHAHRIASFVELDFSHRGQSYRVHRVPTPAGKNVKPSDVRFIAYSDDYVTEADRQTGVRAVNEAVGGLIGLDAEQFMKVMLLPQNEFQEFLLANSTDKEPLLRALFGTTLYQQIAIQMVESAKALKVQADEKSAELAGLRGTIRNAVEALEADGLADDLPDPDEELGRLLELLAAQVAVAADELASASSAAGLAVEARTRGEGEAKRFDASADLVALEVERDRSADATRDAECRLADDERAARVMEAIAVRDEALTECTAAAEGLVSGRSALVHALRTPAGVVPVLAGLRDAAPSAAPSQLRHELATANGKLDGARATLADADTKERDATGYERTADTRDQETHQATVLIEVLRPELDGARAAAGLAREQARDYPALDRQVSDLDLLVQQADVAGAQHAMVKVQRQHDKCRTALDKATAALQKARTARTVHLAGELARDLADGDACPVCGSTDHPNLATGGPETPIEELETTRDQANTAFTSVDAVLIAAQGEVERASAAAALLPTDDDQQVLRGRHAVAERAHAEVDALLAASTDTAERLATAESARNKAMAAAGDARDRAAELRTEVAALLAKAAAIVDATIIDAVAEALDAADECIGELDAATTRHTSAKSQHQLAASNLARALKAERFPSELEAGAALLSASDRNAATGLVEAKVARSQRITMLQGVVGDDPVPTVRPDVDVLKATETEAKAIESAVAKRSTTLTNAHKDISKNERKLAKLGPDVQRLVDRARRARSIADVVHKGAGELLGLERWVQRTVFEEVCDVATDQLRALSHGRYVLTLEASGQRSRTRAGGLDLYVSDGHTGSTRSVASLSGGEKFLTSLALALALAEVVQNRSGGIELSTLFIDEGFGSLDGDTLETAVEVLRTLHDTGRTVGVISHVEAMRQELPVGIQVTPGIQGSTLVMGLAVTGKAA